MNGLFVVNVGVLFFADIPVRLAAGTEVVGLSACRQGAVVGRVLAIAEIETLAEDDVS
jgi:hypothetical protein